MIANNTADQKRFGVSRRYSSYVFGLLFLMYVFDYVDRQVVGALFPYIKRDWGLTDTECGWLASIVTLVMAFLVLPISILVDRWSRRKAMGLMAMLWSAAAALCAFASGFRQLFALRAVIGVGEASYTAGGHAMIAAYFAENRRSTMNGLFNAAVPLGTAIGVTVGGIIAETVGWQYAFGLTALPGFFIALLFFRIKDYRTVEMLKPSSGGASTDAGKMSAKDIALEFLKTPSLLFTYAGYIGVAFVGTALITWLPSYFHRYEGLAMDAAGMKSSGIFLLSILGLPLAGMMVDAMRKRIRNARLVFPAASSLLTAVLLFISLFFFEGKAQYYLFLLVGFVMPMYAAATSAVSQDVIHPGLRAMSYSMVNMVQMSLGYTLGPLFVGVVSDRYDLMTAFRFLPIFCVMSALLFFIGSLYYVSDLEKVRSITLYEE